MLSVHVCHGFLLIVVLVACAFPSSIVLYLGWLVDYLADPDVQADINA